jgi:hypothetical protein
MSDIVTYTGNTTAGKSLLGDVERERFVIKNHAEAFEYGVLRRTFTLDNGTVIDTLYLNGQVLSNVYVPPILAIVEETKKVLVENEFTVYIVDLVSAANSYQGAYVVTSDEIVQAAALELTTHDYTVFAGYFSFKPNLPDADITEESCVCVVNGVANVAADNIFAMSFGHKDDWHNMEFRWIGYPYWFAQGAPLSITQDDYWVGGTLKHPGLFAANPSRYYHLSHSQLTWGEQSRKHIIRHIDQEKRLYRPGQINLQRDDDPERYLMTMTGAATEDGQGPYKMSAYGKRPFTRDTNEKLIAYNERAVVGGAASYVINGVPPLFPAYNMPFFFWPFIPYLWEIPYFNFFTFYNKEFLYGRCITPEPGSAWFRGWQVKYNTVGSNEWGSDNETVVQLSNDSATLTGRENVNVNTSDERPHWIWKDGYVVGMVGSTSGSWTDTDTNSWGYTASVEKTVPIGTVCNGQDLSVMNSMSLVSEYSDNSETVNTKATNLPDSAYLWWPTEPGWWPIGGYNDSSTINRTIIETMAIVATLQSELKFGDTVIESGSGSMAYQYDRNYITNVNNSVSFNVYLVPPGLPFNPNGLTVSGSGTRTDNSQATGNMSRDIVSFAVLDYDSESNFLHDETLVHAVAVVYKKITISHTLNRARNVFCEFDTGGSPQTGIISNGDGFNGWPRSPNEDVDVINVDDHMATSGSRTVEYKLYVNIGKNVYTKTLSTVVINISNSLSPSVSGQRVYGVVCKLQEGLLVLSYDLEEFVEAGNAQTQGGGYDSPFNFEDWNQNGTVKIWETSKRVVGIVKLDSKEGFGTDLYDEQVPISDEVYGVNVIKQVFKTEEEE